MPEAGDDDPDDRQPDVAARLVEHDDLHAEALHGGEAARSDFEAVDNILDVGYFKTLLRRLAAEGRERRIFYEVKANLSREHVRLLVDAGVTWVQPGIESLHSGVLRLMDKGVQGWQNVQLLRFARERGLRLTWSVLWGFPGERDDWYEEMAAWLPALEHLQAPSALIALRYDRYSVYERRAAELGLRRRPPPAMAYVYPASQHDLQELTYFFVEGTNAQPGFAEPPCARPGVRATQQSVERWRAAYAEGMRPALALHDDGEALRVVDTRSCARRAQHRLTGLRRDVLLACDRAPAADRLGRLLAREHGRDAAAAALADAVRELLDARLLLAIDGRLVALPVGGDCPRLPDRMQFPGGYVDPVRAHRRETPEHAPASPTSSAPASRATR